MSSRTEKLLRLVTKSMKEVEDRLLDLPVYESTKSTSKYEREKAVEGWKELEKELKDKENKNFLEQPASLVFNITNEYDFLNSHAEYPFDFEPFQSSGSEYIPSSCSDCDTEKSVEITKQNPICTSDNDITLKNSKSSEICQSTKGTSSKLYNKKIKNKSKLITIHQSAKDKSLKLNKNKIRHKSKLITPKDTINNSSEDEEIDIVSENESNKIHHSETVASSSKHGKDYIKKKSKLIISSDTISNSEDEEINVRAAKNRNGKRVRDKGHSCYFCHKFIINLARHLEVVHENETSVAKILAMPKNSERRRKAFGNILRAGDFYHNCEVLTMKKGELILVRRPAEAENNIKNYSNYGPCPDCLGFMLKKHLWHHMKFNCTKKNLLNKIDDKNKRYPIAESTALLNGIFGTDFSNEYISNIVTKLRNDDVGHICRNDTLIMHFGAMLFEKYNTTQNELIRQYMRQIGRLLLELKSNDDSIKNLSECLIPQKFDAVVKATKNICVTQTQIAKRPEFQVPSLALKIGYALKKCVSIERGIALRNEDLKKNETLMSFLNLMELEWHIRISSNALATLQKRKINSTQLLPLTSDLIKLSKYLDEEMKRLQDEVKRNLKTQSWSRLVTVTLSRIILFNKRRSGESAKLTVEAYTTRPAWSEQSTEELKNSLSKFELHLASKLIIVETEGKRGRKVPVLLTNDMKTSIDLIIKKRNEVGVESKNPFVFARLNNSLGPVRGHDCLRKVCEEADLESPNFITGTKLRKYIATVCQIFNLTENETDWLAKHLGHDIRVHREFYRLHESTVELTKVSRLLLAVDKGEANQFAGKKLNEIDISDLPAYEEEMNAEDNDELVEEENDYNDEEEDLNDQNKIVDKVTCSKNTTTESDIPKTCSKKSGKVNKRTCIKKTWSTAESEAVLKYFKLAIKHERVPRKEECDKCIKNNEILASRKWTDVKFYVKNYISKILKHKKK